MFLVIALVVLLLATPALAEDWMVQYLKSGTVQQSAPVYPNGAYEFVRAPENIPVYLRRNDIWNFIGMYGGPSGGQPQASLPGSFPLIAFPGGTDYAIATPGGGGHVGVPEFSVLRRLPRLPEVRGHVLSAKLAVRSALQHATAWGATAVLQTMQRPATQRGVFIDLKPFTFEVEPWCAGTQGLKLMLAVGLVLALMLRRGLMRGLAFIGLAALIAVEINVVRVAATALTYESIGRAAWGWKDWIAGASTSFGVVQLIGFGWVLKRIEGWRNGS
jgi:exosortase/archaeosortase family protein